MPSVWPSSPFGLKLFGRITLALRRCTCVLKVPADMLVCFLGLKLPHLRIGWAIAWHRMTGTEACLKVGYGKKSRSVLSYFVTQENDTSTSDAKHRHTQYEARLSSQERGAEADVVRG